MTNILGLDYDPVNGTEPDSVPLKNSPLVAMLQQTSFLPIEMIRDRAFIAPFQEAIRSAYPVLTEETAVTFRMTPNGPAPEPVTIWRFVDPTAPWRVSLGREFLSLETVSPTGRREFLSRLGFVLEALSETVKPTHIVRTGLRAVSRVAVGEDASATFRPELIGPVPLVYSLKSPVRSLNSFTVPLEQAGNFTVTCGLFPAGFTHDPNILPPSAMPRSVVLDTDAFVQHDMPVAFSKDQILTEAQRFAGRNYTFFRWAVTKPMFEWLQHGETFAVSPIQTNAVTH